MLAGLNPSEIRDMVPVIRGIAARGITIMMIEHVMQAVMSLAEHVFVLAEGRIIAQGPPEAVAADPLVIEAYLGRGAATLDCTLVYALVPNTLLEDAVSRRARKIAARDLSRVAHTMKLEAQQTSDDDLDARIDAYIRDHLSERELWKEP